MLIEKNTDMSFEKNKACVIKLINLVQHREREREASGELP
jgi:hypothetical protein